MEPQTLSALQNMLISLLRTIANNVGDGIRIKRTETSSDSEDSSSGTSIPSKYLEILTLVGYSRLNRLSVNG